MSDKVEVPVELMQRVGTVMLGLGNQLQSEGYSLQQIMQTYWYTLGYLIGVSGGDVREDHRVLGIEAFAEGYKGGQEVRSQHAAQYQDDGRAH